MNAYTPSANDIDILARTIYGEARGEFHRPHGGLASFIAVANTVMNRLHGPRRFGQNIAEVCLKRYQFSCWNKSDPNLPVIRSIQKGEDALFDLASRVASKVAHGQWPDLTRGSNHYHADYLKKKPFWAEGHIPHACIGSHLFYAL